MASKLLICNQTAHLGTSMATRMKKEIKRNSGNCRYKFRCAGQDSGLTGQDQSAPLIFSLNGQKHELSFVDPSITLNQYIRLNTAYQGTKLACGEGGCGACAVHVSRYNPLTAEVEERSINSCLALLCSLHGTSIITTEGLGSIHGEKPGLHPVQERIAGFHGSQCGYCTPGMCISLFTALRKASGKSGDGSLTIEAAEQAIGGNICRCTGYRPILDACKSFCPEQDIESLGLNIFCSEKADSSALPPYDPAMDPQFPSYLTPLSGGPQITWKDTQESPTVSWHSPSSLESLSSLLHEHKDRMDEVKMVVGNTMSGIYKEEHPSPLVYIDLQRLPDLSVLTPQGSDLAVGSAITISRLIASLQEQDSQLASAMANHLSRLAGPHVRNAGSVGGNLVMAKRLGFESDLATLLLGSGARVSLLSTDLHTVEVAMDEFLGGDGLAAGSVIKNVFIPLHSSDSTLFRSFRAAIRPSGNAHAFVNAAFLAQGISRGQKGDVTVASVRLALGAFGCPHAIRAVKTEEYLACRELNPDTILQAVQLLKTEVVPTAGTRKSAYRVSVAVAFLFSFLSELAGHGSDSNIALQKYQSATSGKQTFSCASDHSPVSEPIAKTGSTLQASGEAVYIDDIPTPSNCLYAAIVGSQYALAEVKGLDYSEAMASPGVVACLDASHIPPGGSNAGTDAFMGSPPELLFGTGLAEFVGHPLAIVVADSPKRAKEGASRVKVLYDTQTVGPPILTIEDAVAADSFFPLPPMILAAIPAAGNFQEAFSSSEKKIENAEVYSGSQQHFYMEPISALAVPDEGNCMVVYSATQSPEGLQKVVAKCLGVSQHAVRVITRRLGGSFGGKLNRASQIGALCALAAHHLRQPVKMTLDRNSDTRIMGGRHAVKTVYDVGFTKEGRVTALRVNSWLNGGFSLDFTMWIPVSFAKALVQYNWGALQVNLHACKTNVSSKTAVRGPGEVQGSFLAETIVEHVAAELGLPPWLVRERNMHSPQSLDKFFPGTLGDPQGYTLPRVWAELKAEASFEERAAEVAAFNAQNRWRKRGIAITPCNYRIILSSKPSLVSIFSDGSVAVQEAGVEMGQGLWTKVQQTAVYALNQLWDGERTAVTLSKVRIVDQDSISLANGSITGASSTSEVSCESVRLACLQLVERLRPIKDKLLADAGPGGAASVTWESVISSARRMDVNLTAQGINKTVGSNGRPSSYFNFGAAISEVEIDVLTGASTVRRCDISYDCGKSLNPAIDIGQVEGAFVMGVGFFTSEEVVVDDKGNLISDGTWEYKPPTPDTIPRHLNVSLLQHSLNHKGVLSSKASGEPPLLLAASVHMAIRQAIAAARKEQCAERSQGDSFFRVDTPATMDVIKEKCGLQLVERHLALLCENVAAGS